MDDVVATIRSFVAGDLSPLEFRDRLYADNRFEAFLNNDPHLMPANYVGRSAYIFLLEQDYDDPGGILNAQGALVDFLDRHGIEYTRTSRYEDFYNLVLRAQPRWLEVDPRYVRDRMLPDAGGRSGAELEAWLREEFPRRFRFVGNPPDWIQSPSWPIGENGPLVFLGQIDVPDYFHDEAAVYVFHDPAQGTCKTVIQVA